MTGLNTRRYSWARYRYFCNMNRIHRLVFAYIFCLLGWQTIHAQERYIGTKASYGFSPQKYTSPPKGYKPVFVEYVGRHASRFFTKPGSDAYLLKIMNGADRTLLGSEILIAIKRIDSIQHSQYGHITLSGRDELRGIGQRMRENYSSAWQNRGIDIVWTDEIRTHQSEAAFMQGFGKYDLSEIHLSSPPDSLNDALRFFKISPAYLKYKSGNFIKEKTDSLLQSGRSLRVSRDVCGRIFKTYDTVSSWKITNALYDMYCLLPSIKKEIAAKGWSEEAFTALHKAFSRADLQWLDIVNQAEDFYEKGPGEDINGIQIKIAVPLLADFLYSIEKEIRQPDYLDAKLNFTHAEAISPFATIMEIKQASHISSSVFDYAENWQADKIMQMGSNIQWILYSNGKTYLLKVLLNEKEVALPISTDTFPYYQWEDVYRFYTAKLKAYGVDRDTNLHDYLLGLKN